MKHFTTTNINDIKAEYKELSKSNHPDLGGDAEIMKEINAEYDELLKNLDMLNDENIEYKNIINDLMKLNVEIEICGSWIWIGGNTYEVRKELKEMGLRYAGKKKKWYHKPADYKGRSRKNYSMDKIRDLHGSKIIKGSTNKKYKIA